MTPTDRPGQLHPCSRCNGSGSEPADRDGMCGDESPSMRVSDTDTVRARRVLRAGHLGWHEGPTTYSADVGLLSPMRWTHITPPAAESFGVQSSREGD